jgi:phosphoribosylaminoimidazole-succinocarboxamide synthase
MLNDDIIHALGIASSNDLEIIRRITLKINQVIKDFLENVGLLFPDFKIELARP